VCLSHRYFRRHSAAAEGESRSQFSLSASGGESEERRERAGMDSAEHDHGELLRAKVVAMVVLGASSLLLGVLPLRLAKWLRWELAGARSQLVLSLLLCFGGGVLFYTTFLHLQPEVREAVAALQRRGRLPTPAGHLHLAELIFCGGFFFVYLVEELVHLCLDSRHEEDDEAVLHRTMSIRKCGRHPEADAASANSQNLIPR